MDWSEFPSSELSSNAAVFVPSSASMPEPPPPPAPAPAPAPEPVAPAPEVALSGFVRLSRRVFVAPGDMSVADMIEELNSSHALGVSEKNMIRLEKEAWGDEEGSSREEAFAAAVIRAFRVKGGKPGPKFWKGVREAVMKQCGTQDLVLLVSDSQCDPTTAGGKIAREQVMALLKNVFEAAETKAAADQMVGLKSGKLLAVLHGWPSNEVRAWSLVADDPLPSQTHANAWSRRHDSDDLSQYYASRQPPHRQVPPRQRQQFPPPPPGRPYPMAHGMPPPQAYPYAGHAHDALHSSHYPPRAPPRQQMASYTPPHHPPAHFHADVHYVDGRTPHPAAAMGGGYPQHVMHPQMVLSQQPPPSHAPHPPHHHAFHPSHHPPAAHHPLANGMMAEGMLPMGGGVHNGFRWAGGASNGAALHPSHAEANGGTQWGWEEPPPASHQSAGGHMMGAPPVSQSLSMREADERAAAAELLWAGHMGGFGGGAEHEPASFGRNGSRAAAGASGGMGGGMSSGINPNARAFTPSSMAPSHACGAVGGGMGLGSLHARQPSLEDFSLRAEAESLWGQVSAPHPAAIGSHACRSASVSSSSAEGSHTLGFEPSQGARLGGALHANMYGMRDGNGGCACLPSSLAMLGMGSHADADAMGASSLLASLGLGESDGSLPGLPHH
ncbi:hypothetical protein AB1Y20_014594 [Prymnesium parvum]|uniref:Uncharacterized protein n=1 Tax=Prymnesium parvum TaxID=97485 RepID=A0AB34IBV4_PRYPA